MQIEVQVAGRQVTLSGRLDAHTVSGARSALHQAVQEGEGDLEVRVDGLEIWDATGLGVLVGAHRLAGRHGRRLVLVGVPPRIERLLRLTRLHHVLHRRVDGPQAMRTS